MGGKNFLSPADITGKYLCGLLSTCTNVSFTTCSRYLVSVFITSTSTSVVYFVTTDIILDWVTMTSSVTRSSATCSTTSYDCTSTYGWNPDWVLFGVLCLLLQYSLSEVTIRESSYSSVKGFANIHWRLHKRRPWLLAESLISQMPLRLVGVSSLKDTRVWVSTCDVRLESGGWQSS